MTLWINTLDADSVGFFQNAVADFTASNPNVTIRLEKYDYQDDYDSKLSSALSAPGTAPDIFFQSGGRSFYDRAQAGQLADLSSLISPATQKAYGNAPFSAFSVGGRVYAIPYGVGLGGLYYSRDLFQQAGVDASAIRTIDDLSHAVDLLEAENITPIVVAGGAVWPASHWYYYFVVRECSKDALESNSLTMRFTDACWATAAANLKDFVATRPFQDDFLTISEYESGGAVDQMANHQAAMELNGTWYPETLAMFTNDGRPLGDLGWFPFPAVNGGQGDSKAMLGGEDAYSCSSQAPQPACADFLNFLAQDKYQRDYANTFKVIPANKNAHDILTDPALREVSAAYQQAPYLVTWLDAQYTADVSRSLNSAVLDLIAGRVSVDQMIAQLRRAAG